MSIFCLSLVQVPHSRIRSFLFKRELKLGSANLYNDFPPSPSTFHRTTLSESLLYGLWPLAYTRCTAGWGGVLGLPGAACGFSRTWDGGAGSSRAWDSAGESWRAWGPGGRPSRAFGAPGWPVSVWFWLGGQSFGSWMGCLVRGGGKRIVLRSCGAVWGCCCKANCTEEFCPRLGCVFAPCCKCMSDDVDLALSLPGSTRGGPSDMLLSRLLCDDSCWCKGWGAVTCWACGAMVFCWADGGRVPCKSGRGRVPCWAGRGRVACWVREPCWSGGGRD